MKLTRYSAVKKVAEQNEDLRKLLNAGHQRGRPALRCVGPLQTPTEFQTFAMVALAGIGKLPDTITDRAVNISMQRRASGESVSQFRSRRDGPVLAALRDRLAAWAKERIDELSKAEPDLPVDDRAADTWEPLVAVADAAGGDWPKLARSACRAIESATARANEDGVAECQTSGGHSRSVRRGPSAAPRRRRVIPANSRPGSFAAPH